MQRLADLFRQHLNGPRWEVTRDVLARQPDALPELFGAMEADLRLLIDQVESGDSAVDVRTTTEHLVLLLGRVVPVIDAVIADVYMMEVVDIEDESADERAQPLGSEAVTELRALMTRLRELETTDGIESGQQVLAIMDASVAIATLHLKCIRLLKELVTGRLEARRP